MYKIYICPSTLLIEIAFVSALVWLLFFQSLHVHRLAHHVLQCPRHVSWDQSSKIQFLSSDAKGSTHAPQAYKPAL